MPGSLITPICPGACDHAPACVAFRQMHGVGTQNRIFRSSMAGYAPACQRFGETLAGNCAWLGADVDHYSFIARDLHSLLLAGLPALRIGIPLACDHKHAVASSAMTDSCPEADVSVRRLNRWRLPSPL